MRRLVVLVLVVAATCVAAPAKAASTSIVGKVAYVTTSADVNGGSDAALISDCPSGFGVVGGGGGLTGAVGTVWLSEFLFTGSHTSLSADGHNSGGTTQTMTDTAICLKDVVSRQYFTDLSTASGDLSHGCTTGSFVIGGAGGADPPDDVAILESDFPFKETTGAPFVWELRAFTADPTPHYELDTACVPNGAIPLKHIRKEVVLDANTTKTVSAACPRRWHVASGGFDTGNATSLASVSKPFDNGDRGHAPDNGWRATVNNGSGTSTVLAVHALCIH